MTTMRGEGTARARLPSTVWALCAWPHTKHSANESLSDSAALYPYNVGATVHVPSAMHVQSDGQLAHLHSRATLFLVLRNPDAGFNLAARRFRAQVWDKHAGEQLALSGLHVALLRPKRLPWKAPPLTRWRARLDGIVAPGNATRDRRRRHEAWRYTVGAVWGSAKL